MGKSEINICVCFKILPDYSMITEQEWQRPEQIDFNLVKKEFNDYDASSLELALRLKDQMNERAQDNDQDWPSVHLTALTIEGAQADTFLRYLYALGFDNCTRIEPKQDMTFAPLSVTHNLAQFIADNPQDIVFTGKQSGIGDHGQIGFLLAEFLDWPVIRETLDAHWPEQCECKKDLHIKSRISSVLAEQIIQTPVVLIVGDTPYSPYLRIPPLKKKLMAKKRTITTQDMTSPLQKEEYELQKWTQPQQEKKCIILDEISTELNVKKLINEHLT